MRRFWSSYLRPPVLPSMRFNACSLLVLRAWSMAALREANFVTTAWRARSKSVSARAMSVVNCAICSTADSSWRWRSFAIRILNSRSNLSSRALKSATTVFRPSRSSMVLSTPNLLLTITPDFFDELVQLFDDDHGGVHVGDELFHVF